MNYPKGAVLVGFLLLMCGVPGNLVVHAQGVAPRRAVPPARTLAPAASPPYRLSSPGDRPSRDSGRGPSRPPATTDGTFSTFPPV